VDYGMHGSTRLRYAQVLQDTSLPKTEKTLLKGLELKKFKSDLKKMTVHKELSKLLGRNPIKRIDYG